MPTDVIIDPSTGQIYWNDSTGSPQSISIKGDAVNAISFIGYSGSFSPGSTPAGASTLVTVNDNSGTDALVPGTSGFNLGSATLRWNTFATNANLSGTLVVSDSTISSSLLTGSVRFNGGIAISGNASIGQSLNFYNTSNANYVGFKAGVTAANTLYTLPTNFPGAGTSVLQSDTFGTLSWTGIVGNATTAQNINIVSANTGIFYPLFTSASTTTSGIAVSINGNNLSYNFATNVLTAAVFSGNFTGTAVTATNFFGALTGNVTGSATTAQNINVVSASTSANHPVLFTPSTGSASGAAVSTEPTFVFNAFTDILSVSGLAVTATTASTSPTTGALIVSSGVGIGGSLYVGGTGSSISGVRISSAAIFSGDTTFALINTNATTVNAFGSATTMSIGAATGKATFNSTDNSTTVNTGSLIVSGGAGIAKSLSVGGYLQLFNANFYTSFVSSGTGNTVYTLPATSPATGSSVLQSTSAGVMSWVPLAASGGVATGVASRMAYYASAGSAITDTYGFQYATSGTAQTISVFGGAAIGNTIFVISAPSSTSVRVGIGVSNPVFELEVNGEISATNKSFVINHPTKPGMKLRYGSLEGPENGVYIRGISTSNIIELPDYWLGLVDYNTITVHLTPIGKNNSHYFLKCEDNKVHIGTSLFKKINCFYSIWAERKDVPKLTVEY